jgi:hypothetical protein
MPRPRKVVLEVQETEKLNDIKPNPEKKQRRKKKLPEPKGIEIIQGDFIITFQ